MKKSLLHVKSSQDSLIILGRVLGAFKSHYFMLKAPKTLTKIINVRVLRHLHFSVDGFECNMHLSIQFSHSLEGVAEMSPEQIPTVSFLSLPRFVESDR